MGTCAKGSSIELSQNWISASTIIMATTVIEQSEDSTKLKFSLPSVVYSGSSLTLCIQPDQHDLHGGQDQPPTVQDEDTPDLTAQAICGTVRGKVVGTKTKTLQ